MKKREKSVSFANRIGVRKKQAKRSQLSENDAAFLSSYNFTHQKCIRKSPPFLDKNRFANSTPFRVYYPVGTAKNDALRSLRKGLFLSPCQKTVTYYSYSGAIAEALPRVRGLKYRTYCLYVEVVIDCRGIAPSEGTEIRLRHHDE